MTTPVIECDHKCIQHARIKSLLHLYGICHESDSFGAVRLMPHHLLVHERLFRLAKVADDRAEDKDLRLPRLLSPPTPTIMTVLVHILSSSKNQKSFFVVGFVVAGLCFAVNGCVHTHHRLGRRGIVLLMTSVSTIVVAKANDSHPGLFSFDFCLFQSPLTRTCSQRGTTATSHNAGIAMII